MQSANITCDYVIITLNDPDSDLYRVEGQVDGQPLFLLFVEGSPLVHGDTKVIPEPTMFGNPSTEIYKPSEGYVLEMTIENGNHLYLSGKKLEHCPPFNIYS